MTASIPQATPNAQQSATRPRVELPHSPSMVALDAAAQDDPDDVVFWHSTQADPAAQAARAKRAGTQRKHWRTTAQTGKASPDEDVASFLAALKSAQKPQHRATPRLNPQSESPIAFATPWARYNNAVSGGTAAATPIMPRNVANMRVPIPHANDENDDAFQRPAPVMSKKRTRPVSSSASPSETMLGNAQRPAIGATPLAIDRTPVHASTGIDSRPPPSTGSRHRKQVQVRALTDLLLNVFVESHSNANSELAVEVADEEQVEDKSRNNSDTTEREPTNDDTIIEQNTATMFQPIVQAEVGTVPADTHPPPADVLPPTTIVVEQEAAGSDIYDFDPLLEHITLSQQCTVAGCEGSPTPPSRSQSSASQPECVSRFRPTPFGVNDTEYADQNVTEVCALPVATGTTVDDLDDFPLDPGMEKAMASSQAMLDESAQDGESCHALKQQSLAPSPPAATTADSPTKTGLRRHQTMPAVQTPVRTHTAGHESHAIQVCRKTASDGGSDYGDFNMDLESAELLNVLSQCDVVAASNNDSVSPTTLLQQQKQQQVQSHPLPEISNTDPTADHRDAPAQLEMTNIDDPYDNDDDSFFKNPELEQILDQANSANNATG